MEKLLRTRVQAVVMEKEEKYFFLPSWSLCESITIANQAFESFESRSRSPRGCGNPYARASSAHSQSPLIHPVKAADMKRENDPFHRRGKRGERSTVLKGELVIYLPFSTG